MQADRQEGRIIATSTSATTIVTAIEAGTLEQQVLMLAESLRLFGGRWADLPFLAIKPRRGAPLERHTRRELDRLGVHLVEEHLVGRYSWWNHFNKVAAMEYAEARVDTAHVTWLDSDMVVVREPDDFRPPDGAAFIARAGEATDVASDGTDASAEYWHRLCGELGLSFEAFPTVTSFPEGRPIKAYFQSGYYSYPVATRLSAEHRRVFQSLLDGTIKSRTAGTFHMDQVSLALTVQVLGLEVHEADPRMNFNLNVTDPGNADALPIEEVRIIQYHGSLWPQHFPWVRPYLNRLSPPVASLIRHHAPWRPPHLPQRVVIKLLREWRQRQVQALERRTVAY